MSFYAIWDGDIIHTDYETYRDHPGLNAVIVQSSTEGRMTIYNAHKKLMRAWHVSENLLRGAFQDYEEP